MKSIRGAITIEKNTEQCIQQATIRLLEEMVRANNLTTEQVIQCTFSCTKDIDQAYPAKFAREIGWSTVPLLCMQEMYVEGSLSMCIRVMLLVDMNQPIHHVYLEKAKVLRPDLSE